MDLGMTHITIAVTHHPRRFAVNPTVGSPEFGEP